MDEYGRTQPRTLQSFDHLAGQWKGAGGRRTRRFQLSDLRGVVRSGCWNLDDDESYADRTICAYGYSVAQRQGTGCWRLGHQHLAGGLRSLRPRFSAMVKFRFIEHTA